MLIWVKSTLTVVSCCFLSLSAFTGLALYRWFLICVAVSIYYNGELFITAQNNHFTRCYIDLLCGNEGVMEIHCLYRLYSMTLAGRVE